MAKRWALLDGEADLPRAASRADLVRSCAAVDFSQTSITGARIDVEPRITTFSTLKRLFVVSCRCETCGVAAKAPCSRGCGVIVSSPRDRRLPQPVSAQQSRPTP